MDFVKVLDKAADIIVRDHNGTPETLILSPDDFLRLHRRFGGTEENLPEIGLICVGTAMGAVVIESGEDEQFPVMVGALPGGGPIRIGLVNVDSLLPAEGGGGSGAS